ncbi:MAG: hypothetical protein ABII64_08305 [Elusimicrobiota bacterium]
MKKTDYSQKFNFTGKQVKGYLNNAFKDLEIARNDRIPEVKFTYSYTALLKGGIALIAGVKKSKIASMPGHHIEILRITGKILDDEMVFTVGNAMRMKRNTDLYQGGIVITELESKDYYAFSANVLDRIRGRLNL